MLKHFEQNKGDKIFELTIPELGDEDLESYALRVFEQWGVGRRSIDDGVLVLVAVNDRKMRIEVGYGLEGAVPDIVAGGVIGEEMVPELQERDYTQGQMATATQLEQERGGQEERSAVTSGRLA